MSYCSPFVIAPHFSFAGKWGGHTSYNYISLATFPIFAHNYISLNNISNILRYLYGRTHLRSETTTYTRKCGKETGNIPGQRRLTRDEEGEDGDEEEPEGPDNKREDDEREREDDGIHQLDITLRRTHHRRVHGRQTLPRPRLFHTIILGLPICFIQPRQVQ